MAKSVSGFITGLEDMTFVERLSNTFAVAPSLVVRILATVLGIGLVLLLCMGALLLQETPLQTIELETASSTVHSSTDFDSESKEELAVAVEPALPLAAVVYVTGAVVNPGVYTLTPDNRISDAVLAAGGLTSEAATAVVNLAQPLSDGLHIHIPFLHEVTSNVPVGNSDGLPTSQGVLSSEGGGDRLVNINTANNEELQTLDGVGPATAQKIIDYRTANGPFQKKEDLKNVSGIGDKKYAALEARITV